MSIHIDDNSQEKKVSDKYMEKFQDKQLAKEYNEVYEIKSISDFFNIKKLVGWLIAKSEVRAIKKLLAFCEGSLILDAPCGTGKITSELIGRNLSVVGLDSSEEMLSKIHYTKSRSFYPIKADIRNLPLTDKSVDIVICNRLLHRIPQHSHLEFMEEFYRVNKQPAIIYFSVRSFLTNFVTFLERNLGIGDRGNIFYMSRNDIKNEMDVNGWNLVRGIDVIPFISTGFIVLVRKKVL